MADSFAVSRVTSILSRDHHHLELLDSSPALDPLEMYSLRLFNDYLTQLKFAGSQHSLGLPAKRMQKLSSIVPKLHFLVGFNML